MMDNKPNPDLSQSVDNEATIADLSQFQSDELVFDQQDGNFEWDQEFESLIQAVPPIDHTQNQGNEFGPPINQSPSLEQILDQYGGLNNVSSMDTYYQEPDPIHFDDSVYSNDSFQHSSLLEENTFDLSALTLAELEKGDTKYISDVFSILEQRDPDSQRAFFNRLGLDLENEVDLKFLAKLNNAQAEFAVSQGLLNISENNNSRPPEDRLYTTADSKLYLTDKHTDFNLSIEEYPFEAVQVAEKTLFDFESKSFYSQAYYALSLKGANSENAQNFLSNRHYDIENLTNQNQAIREAKKQLYNEVSNAPNTYFSNSLKEKSDVLALERHLQNFCLIRGLDADDVGLKAKTIVMDQWLVNDDHTAAALQTVEIPYLEFNEKFLTKEIIQLLEDRDQDNAVNASILLKDHLGEEYFTENSSKTTDSQKNEKSTGIPKNELKLDGAALDNKNSLSAHSVAAKNFKDLKHEELAERPPLARENAQGYPRTVADEIAAMSAKAIATIIEATKKMIKLIIAAIKALFNRSNDQTFESEFNNLKEIWNAPLSADLKVKGGLDENPQTNPKSVKSGIEEPKLASATKPVPIESVIPLLNDPYTTKLNKDRDGISLEEFDSNIAKVYDIEGEQYIVIDVVKSDIEGGPSQLKLVNEKDLPQKSEESDLIVPITPFYLETIENNIKFLSIDDLHEGIKNNKIHEFEGTYFEPLCSQYIEQARLYLGAESAFGTDPSNTSEETKLSYKEQFALKAFQSGQVISYQFDKFKNTAKSLIKKFTKTATSDSENESVVEQSSPINASTDSSQRDIEINQMMDDAKLTAVGAMISTNSGQYAVLAKMPLEMGATSAKYFAVPVINESQIDVQALGESSIQIIDSKDVIAFHTYSPLNPENASETTHLSPEVYDAITKSIEMNCEVEFIKALEQLNLEGIDVNQEFEQIKSSLFDNKEPAAVNNPSQSLQEKETNLSAIHKIADSLENIALRNIVKSVATTLSNPFESDNPLLSQELIHLSERLDQLQQDILLQANTNLTNEAYKAAYEKEDHLVLTTSYGPAEYLNFNSQATAIKDLIHSEENGHLFDNFNSLIEKTGEVEIAIQNAKQELIKDHYIAAVHEDVKIHRLNEQDLNRIIKLNDHINNEFQGTGGKMRGLELGLNHSTANYLEKINTEKAFVTEILNNFSSEMNLEINRKNSHENGQTLG